MITSSMRTNLKLQSVILTYSSCNSSRLEQLKCLGRETQNQDSNGKTGIVTYQDEDNNAQDPSRDQTLYRDSRYCPLHYI